MSSYEYKVPWVEDDKLSTQVEELIHAIIKRPDSEPKRTALQYAMTAAMLAATGVAQDLTVAAQYYRVALLWLLASPDFVKVSK